MFALAGELCPSFAREERGFGVAAVSHRVWQGFIWSWGKALAWRGRPGLLPAQALPLAGERGHPGPWRAWVWGGLRSPPIWMSSRRVLWEEKNFSLPLVVFRVLACLIVCSCPFAGKLGRYSACFYHLKSLSLGGRMQKTEETNLQGQLWQRWNTECFLEYRGE